MSGIVEGGHLIVPAVSTGGVFVVVGGVPVMTTAFNAPTLPEEPE